MKQTSQLLLPYSAIEPFARPTLRWSDARKRGFDLLAAFFGLLLAAIPMLLLAAAIKLDDGGPILYRQCRLTAGRRRFTLLKFRTMREDAEATGPVFASENDPRCTQLGRWLRATCLDELPQLFNVLLGDMSLVGPRPERPEMLARIQREIPEFPLRLHARAGLTGLAQIRGFRGQTCLRTRLHYDLHYIHHRSLWLDLRILLATLPCLLPRGSLGQ